MFNSQIKVKHTHTQADTDRQAGRHTHTLTHSHTHRERVVLAHVGLINLLSGHLRLEALQSMLHFFFVSSLLVLFSVCFVLARFAQADRGEEGVQRGNKANSQHLLTFIVALSTPLLASFRPPTLKVLLSFKLIFSVNDKSFSLVLLLESKLELEMEMELLVALALLLLPLVPVNLLPRRAHTHTHLLAPTHLHARSAFCFQLIVYPCQSHVPITQARLLLAPCSGCGCGSSSCSCSGYSSSSCSSHQRDCHNMNYVSRQRVQVSTSPQQQRRYITIETYYIYMTYV